MTVELSFNAHDKGSFVAWIHNTPDYARFRYCRIWATSIRLRPETETGYTAVELPSVAKAGMWWDELWEQHVTDFWIYEGAQLLVCGAKGGIWRPQSSLHAELGVGDFRMIDNDEFERLVGESMAHEMCNEIRRVGVSVRTVTRDHPRPTVVRKPRRKS